MNDINELITIIISHGGEASFDDIVNSYGKKFKIAIQAQHRSVIKRTLKSAPQIVLFDESKKRWCLHTKDKQLKKSASKPETVLSGSVQFLRKAAYDWAMRKYNEGEIIGIYGNVGQRQYIVTPGIAEIVPKVSEKGSPYQSGYYCLYEVEIRPTRAVVRLMASVTNETPISIIEAYKRIVLPAINKVYREDGSYYNKTFVSKTIYSTTTNKEIVSMMDEAFQQIKKFEESLNTYI